MYSKIQYKIFPINRYWFFFDNIPDQDLLLALNLANIAYPMGLIGMGEFSNIIYCNLFLKIITISIAKKYNICIIADGENLTKLPVMLNLYPLNADRRYPQTIHEILNSNLLYGVSSILLA